MTMRSRKTTISTTATTPRCVRDRLIHAAAIAACAALAACGTQPTRNAADVDIAHAANRAQATVAAYGAGGRKPARATTVTPLPAGMPAVATARYVCRDGSTWQARFDNRADTLALSGPAGKATLEGLRAASGFWYAADGWELRGKGRDAMLRHPGAPPIPCTAA